MKKFKKLLLIIGLFVLVPALANAQIVLDSPPDGAALTDPPNFAWTPSSPYDAYFFYSVFYYDIGTWSGYLPGYFWLLQPGFAMPQTWWDNVGEDMTCYWAVLGYERTTPSADWSRASTFTKTSSCTDAGCCGSYVLGCCDDPGTSVCLTGADGEGFCGMNISCSDTNACASDADCAPGMKCAVCTCCDSPSTDVCVPLCGSGVEMLSVEGPTAAGE
jgi:hypothetical protein